MAARKKKESSVPEDQVTVTQDENGIEQVGEYVAPQPHIASLMEQVVPIIEGNVDTANVHILESGRVLAFEYGKRTFVLEVTNITSLLETPDG